MPALLRFHLLRTAVVAAVLAAFVVAPSAPARAVASSAFVRVNPARLRQRDETRLPDGFGRRDRCHVRRQELRRHDRLHRRDRREPRLVEFGYPDVYALDFDSVTTAGTYTITVTGPIAATSPTFRVDSGQNVYAGAMANAVSFYQNQRDGANYIPSALRTAPGHLNDATAMTYATPHAKSSAASPATSRRSASPSTPPAAGGTPATTSSSCRPRATPSTSCSPACATSRPRWARRSTPRPGSAPTGCSACGTTPPGRCTTRSASAKATPRSSATTTSGGCRRPTTPTAAPRPPTGTSAIGRCSRPTPPAD